ncbi:MULTISPECIES: hypothetical protein [unclassified Streptomyces]|uniref:hypothetical protein n=1 Tax=unclassified Streptomyces TaxID=2593676 RepID=UPI002251AAE7|nr:MULTISPECIES: hypothetical protein [unclassified Streptomyces]MCX5058024.1 hypothetical protein [Streptomyces sp. NBC_00452]
MKQQDVHDELRARLHEAARTHEPNRARILARVERGMSERDTSDRAGHRATRPPVWGWARVVGATAAVAGMLAVGGYAVASAVKDDTHPQQQTVTVSPTPTPSPDATMSRAPVPPVEPAPSRSSGSSRADNTPSTKPSSSVLPPAAGEQDGPLWSVGSVDPKSNEFWAQSDLTLKNAEQFTSLTVQLKVAQTGGVSSTGAWRALPEKDFDLTIGEQDGFLVYTWVLKEGRSVPKGEWEFAGQYDHARGARNAKDDSYTVKATAGGKQYAVSGGFAAQTGATGDS